jgi:hypothetical protein
MPAGVQGKISITEAMNTCRFMLQVPQRAVPLLRSTPGVGKSEALEQLAVEFFATYAKGKGCKGCEAEGGPSHNPQEHVRGCGGYHEPAMCNICAKDRIVITEKVDANGTVTARVPSFQPYPAHVMLIDIRLSTFDPIETKGLPYVPAEGDLAANVNGQTKVLTRWACPEWLPTDNEVYCILFLDEFLNAPAAVQNAALQLIYDKKVHTHKLGRLVSVACAGNTEGDGSYITRLGGAAKNRLAHLEIEVDSASWLTWAKQQHDIPAEFIGAVDFKADSFLPAEFSKEMDAQPTPRSYTTLARLVFQTGARTDKEIRRLANPLIGNGATVELIGYIGSYQKIKPQDIILEGKMPVFEKEQASLRYAAACSVANYLHKNPAAMKDKKHVDHFFAFLKLLGGEITTKCLSDIHLNEHTSLVGLLLRHCAPEFKVMMQDLAEALTADDEKPSGARRRA